MPWPAVVPGEAAAGGEAEAGKMEEAAATGSPAVGQQASDFNLMDQNDNPVRLRDLRGKWVVLYFYPKDDTPGCIREATHFTKLLFQLKNMNAVVYGVSEDSTASHRQFIEKHSLALPLLSDPDHKVMKEYGAWVTTNVAGKTLGRAIRTTFLIGPDGVIRYHWPEVIPQGHAERVREKLAELQREHHEE